MFNSFKLLSIASVLLILFSSCGSTKKATYFNDLEDAILNSSTPLPEPVIKKNDILSITVNSLSAEATVIFNAPNNSSVNVGRAESSGYLVAPDGNIQFPILGTLKAEGLTKTELKENITKEILNRKLLLDPNIIIRFLNFRVTVLGEVQHPTVVEVPSEKISLLEALGMAGDMTIFAKRDNVLIIREENSQKRVKRINLNSRELFNSPYYYLQSNDIVYVEPNKAKIATASNVREWLPLGLSGLSFIAILADRIFR